MKVGDLVTRIPYSWIPPDECKEIGTVVRISSSPGPNIYMVIMWSSGGTSWEDPESLEGIYEYP